METDMGLFGELTESRFDHIWRNIKLHAAIGLLAFTGLQIIVIASLGGDLLLHFGLIMSLALYARMSVALERRWPLSQMQTLEERRRSLFAMDLAMLWGVSLFGPFLWMPLKIILTFIIHLAFI